ncbi:hypothetical protein ACIBCR_14815 [Micromonospora echinospora]|uniref:hypothetical protein n=1 Tax=Micromonospora echinospora TaxID=1877 RepID=UPI00379FA755
MTALAAVQYQQSRPSAGDAVANAKTVLGSDVVAKIEARAAEYIAAGSTHVWCDERSDWVPIGEYMLVKSAQAKQAKAVNA